MVIYVDVLVSLNILFTYIFLVCTRLVSNTPTSRIGVVLASVLGGFSSLIVFYREIGVFLSLFYKLFVSSAIVLLSFLPKGFKRFFRSLLIFFGVSIVFGGAMYFIELTFKPHNIIYFNGTVYFDMSIKYLVASVFVIYGVFKGADFLLQRKASSNEIYSVKISFRASELTLRGFIDTGNSVKDAITGKLVIVGELSSLAPLFTYEELKALKSRNYELIGECLKGIIYFVPCGTVGDSFLMPVFTPKKIELIKNGKSFQIKDACIGIVNKDLSEGEYNLLLNKDIFNQVMV